MEQLARMIICVFLVSALALIGGLWLLHTAVNDGNVWKGIVAVVLTLAAGFYFVVSAGVFGGSQ